MELWTLHWRKKVELWGSGHLHLHWEEPEQVARFPQTYPISLTRSYHHLLQVFEEWQRSRKRALPTRMEGIPDIRHRCFPTCMTAIAVEIHVYNLSGRIPLLKYTYFVG